MAIYFVSANPQALLNAFDSRIEQDEAKGKITTWLKSADGEYYTHASAEWRKKAWFKPVVESTRLTFNIIKPKNAIISSTVYGYYHGHLIETFLNHFDDSFETGCATALPASGDHCS
ncbi:MAG: hypothetical protein H0X25_03440 [Acidobacteriales bacterium]|nr:hypothetical protein [Terriglobales bacterium]